MKYLYKTCIVAFFAVFCLVSCDDMNDAHLGYLERGEKVYAAKVDSVSPHAGYGRIEMEVFVYTQKIDYIRFFWNARSDSADFNIGRAGVFECLIDNLSEKEYLFEIISFDKYGNKSLPFEVSGSAYGDSYLNRLSNRSITSIYPSLEGLVINWGAAPENALYCEAVYTDIESRECTFRASATQSETLLPDWSDGFRYRTYYLPTATAIDTVSTDWIIIEDDVLKPSITPFASWSFEDESDLAKANVNNGVSGTHLGLFGEVTSVDGPTLTNKAVRIGAGGSNYLKVTHGISFPAGLDYLPDWTVMIVFRMPDLIGWHTILQTDITPAGDADFFVRDNGLMGVGALGYVGPALTAGTWYRLIMSRHDNIFNSYVNGVQYHNNVNAENSRFNLLEAFLISQDEDNEDKAIEIAEIAVWKEPLTVTQRILIEIEQRNK